jgi:3-oxoacyl-[acyl-carrier-protein] synthase II
MSRKRVVITGMGTINPLGHGVAATWEELLAGRTGISKTEIFDASTFPSTFSAQVKDFNLADHVEDAHKHRHAGRHCTFAIAAAVQAWKQSGLGDYDKLDRDRLGIYLGSGEGSLDFDNFISLVVDAWNEDDTLNAPEWGRLGFERMDMHREVEQESHMVVAHLAAEFGARGPAFNVLTACAASTQALGEATCMIRRGEADAIISGGAHSMIHPLGVMGFNRLTALSVRNDDITTASRPFDATRDGFVLGEGASILILEDYDKVVERGASDNILAEIVGYGSSADAFRITDQDPRGDGAAAAMRAALEDARMAPDRIDYISAHGTGTTQNDQVETLAMKQIFGPETAVPISSAKSMLGHLIAAAGATELITCIKAMQDHILPPTANLNTPDPDCDLDYIPNTPREASVTTCMSNSMGFGGQNNTLIITAGARS